MTLFVYADESGVFDVAHNIFFVFGGVIVRSKQKRDIEARKYRSVERSLGANAGRTKNGELKATTLSNRDKYRIYRSLGGMTRFAVVVQQDKVLAHIFNNKKSKQRFLDFVFKVGLKAALVRCIERGLVPSDYDGRVSVRMDEHTTATDGRYELRESLEQEFRFGTYNYTWSKHFPPLFPSLRDVTVEMRDSASDPLIRAADIVANRVYHHATQGTLDGIQDGVIIAHWPPAN